MTLQDARDHARAIAYGYGLRGDDLEDAAQEGVIAFWRDSITFEDNGAYNTHAMKLKLRKVVGRDEPSFGHPGGGRHYRPTTFYHGDDMVVPEAAVDGPEEVTVMRDEVRRFLSVLSDRERDVVARVRMYGHPVTEIAAEYGVTRKTVHNWLAIAVGKMRDVV